MKNLVSRFATLGDVGPGTKARESAAPFNPALGATLIFDATTLTATSGGVRRLESTQPSSQSAIAAYPYLHVGLGNTGHLLEEGGGEFHLVDPARRQRLATLMPIPVLGHAMPIYRPWQITYAYLASMFDWDDLMTAYGGTDLLQFLNVQGQASKLHTETVTAPRSSACGYLCDAVAAAIGLSHQRPIARGQGDWHLRSTLTPQALRSAETAPYEFRIRLLHHRNQPLPYLDPRSMWQQLLEDLQEQEPATTMAGRFYLGLIRGIASMLSLLAQTHAVKSIALSGHMLQHPMLSQAVARSLRAALAENTQVA